MLISHMQIPRGCVPNSQKLGPWPGFRGPWSKTQMGLCIRIAPATRGHQGFTSGQAGPELPGVGGFSQREAKLNLLRLSAAREPKAFSIHAGFKSN